MVSKFQSPAQDYAAHRISLDDVCNTQRNSVYLVRADGGAVMAESTLVQYWLSIAH
jgi:hypothetical protein